jgi:hypothetical protein
MPGVLMLPVVLLAVAPLMTLLTLAHSVTHIAIVPETVVVRVIVAPAPAGATKV